MFLLSIIDEGFESITAANSGMFLSFHVTVMWQSPDINSSFKKRGRNTDSGSICREAIFDGIGE